MSHPRVSWVHRMSASMRGVERQFRVVVHHPDAAFRAAWDDDVQPEIDRVGYMAHRQREAFRGMGFPEARVEEASVREDSGWQWAASMPAGEIARAEILGASTGLQPALFALSIVDQRTVRLVPAAMLLLCEAFEPDPRILSGQCVFLWYLSLAPDSTFSSLPGGPLRPDDVGPLALDVALSRSFHLGYRGRLLVHAREIAGAALLESYERWGLARVPSSPAVVAEGRRNDGRYFFADEATAERLSVRLDPLRQLGLTASNGVRRGPHDLGRSDRQAAAAAADTRGRRIHDDDPDEEPDGTDD